MPKSLHLLITVLILGMSVCFNSVYGQISYGGTPESFNLPIRTEVEVREYPKVNVKALLAEDELNSQKGDPLRFAKQIPVNLSLDNSGSWIDLDDGRRIWRMKIKSESALGLGLYYDRFYIPPGGKFFVYSEDKQQVLGAYTNANNPKGEEWATEIISGDALIVEYIEPQDVISTPVIDIKSIMYVYKDVPFLKKTQDKLNNTGGCHLNINCSPEGDNWQDQKKGVSMISIKISGDTYLCTGSLVNNTANDCTPYFLSAYHCGDGASTSDFNQWTFYFHYEAPACENPSSIPSSTKSTVGATKRASAPFNFGTRSDLLFLELNNFSEETAITWGVYFNGWSRSTTASSSGVGIHHPGGDIKKISTYSSSLVNYYTTHWKVVWSPTVSGWGVTEQGSSGSPIFNDAGLIVGTLSSGWSACGPDSLMNGDGPDQPDHYGKFSYHWQSNGTFDAMRLRPWLDPIGSNPNELEGKYAPCSYVMPGPDFVGIPVGGYAPLIVDFTDQSTGAPISWAWDFGDGGSSVEQSPQHTFDTAGVYTVTLTVTNSDTSASIIKTDYITVIEPIACDDITSFPYTEDFEALTDDFVCWQAKHNSAGLSGDSLINISAAIFNDNTWFVCSPTSFSGTGADYINNGQRSAAIGYTAPDFNWLVSPNFVFDDNNYRLRYWSWQYSDSVYVSHYYVLVYADGAWNTVKTFIDGTIDEFANEITVDLSAYNNKTIKIAFVYEYTDGFQMSIDDIVVEQFAGINDHNDVDAKIQVFPNPSSGKVYVTIADTKLESNMISVYSSIGHFIREIKCSELNQTKWTIDFSHVANGLYFIRFETESGTAIKKISIAHSY